MLTPSISNFVVLNFVVSNFVVLNYVVSNFVVSNFGSYLVKKVQFWLFFNFQLLEKEGSLEGKTVVVVLTGGNVTPNELINIL